MPLWAPGAYEQVGYGRFVENFSASDDKGNKNPVVRVNDNRWLILDAKNVTKIHYEVRTSHTDTVGQYYSKSHIDTDFFFANGTALFGYINDTKNVPSTIIYSIPPKWTLHCALETNKPLEFTAKDYDELVDAPIMAAPDLYVKSFNHERRTFDIVLSSDAPFPMDSLVLLTKYIISAQADFWGDLPFEKYLFLFRAPTLSKLPLRRAGALEHSNSSVYLLPNLPWEYLKDKYAHVISHEFFHAWNVKRIHSSKLGPFDYTKPVRTTSLWLSEGITDYYADLLLSRYGICDEEYFEKSLRQRCIEMESSPYAYKYTLEEFSHSSVIGLSTGVTYFKGALVGLLLDLEIRTQTHNKKSLDDVMYGLYKRAKNGIHFEDNELQQLIDSISGASLLWIYASYIEGKDSIPLGTFLEKIGLRWTSSEDIIRMTGVNFLPVGSSHDDPSRRFYVTWIDTNSRYYRAGLRSNDILLSVNDTNVVVKNSSPLFYMLEDTSKFSVEILRDEKKIVLDIREGKTRKYPIGVANTITRMEEATPEQRAMRQGIYGKKEGW